MRSFGLALVSLALGSTVVNAQMSMRGISPRGSRSSRASRSLGALRARQATTDVCANLDGDELVVNDVVYGDLSGVLCLSQVASFITTNDVAEAAVAEEGEEATTNALNDLVNATGETCTYPENAIPAGTADNVCAFTCGNGFTPSPAGAPTTCACEAPAADCNGVCTTDACPSAAPAPGRRGYMNSLRKRAMCSVGTTACGVYERRGARSLPFECVHTDTDLESCGGCTTPLDRFSPVGVDCTQIPGVIDVKCMFGACVVNRCTSGYVRAADNSSCVLPHRLLQQN
ncbi:hypothetical protein C8T65DRAFT_803808 [Cerioporus squamosus]|nr:hypothetical protein C8T65DRAFT_803808 [Cerioporus squamosus]